MKKTFICNESMVITIPIGNLRDAQEGQLMPEKFYCVFEDTYKVFAIKGKPKPLGAAQAITGVFLLILGLVFQTGIRIFTLPSVVFVICGMLTFAAGLFPNMVVTKLSFLLNIVCFFWSIAACAFCINWFMDDSYDASLSDKYTKRGVNGLIMSLLIVEDLMALFLIFWLSKAVCRRHFNSLPTVLLKQAD